MPRMTARLGLSLRAETLAAVAAAGALAAVLVWVGPQGTDLAAHAYQRTLYLQHGFVLWNNFWYAGRYSFVTYSVLYYPLAALLGIKLLAVLTVVLTVAAFAAVVRREWGARSRWSVRVFALAWAALVVSSCVLGIALTWRVTEARALRWMSAAYLAVCSASFAVSSPIGENIARLRFAAAPIAVLTMSLRNWRPRVVCVAVLGLAVSWNVTPLAASFVHGVDDPAGHAAYWAPATRFLQTQLPPEYRVEAVDTVNHWPADFLARAGIPLVRGWFRQEDFPQNSVLYSPLGSKAYVRWLREMGVRYVVLTSRPPDYSSRDEAQLLASGRTHLRVAFATPNMKIFAVPDPRPLVSRPARVRRLGYTTIALQVPRPGTYRLAVTYTPYWESQTACLTRAPDGMTRLVVQHRGLVLLHFAVTPRRALDTIAGRDPEPCP